MTTSTLLYGFIVVQLNEKTATCSEHCNRKLPKWMQILRNWSRAGVVKLKTKLTPKSESCGGFCMFVGYVESHSDGFYRMWNENINRIHLVEADVFAKEVEEE